MNRCGHRSGAVRAGAARERQQGFVLVVAVMFLAVLTVFSVHAVRTSSLEERMAANTQHHKVSFRIAETGLSLAMTGAASATTATRREDNETTYLVNIVAGEVCNSETPACSSGWSEPDTAVVEAGTEYVTEAKVPPEGFSLDGPFATHHFRIDTEGRYGTTVTNLSGGFQRLGPRPE